MKNYDKPFWSRYFTNFLWLILILTITICCMMIFHANADAEVIVIGLYHGLVAIFCTSIICLTYLSVKNK